MILEIENELYKRVHSTLGQSAVVLRLAEDLDQSGRVAENTLIIISWVGGSNLNPHPGAYIPTTRNRTLTYKVTVIQQNLQRSGHSFVLPILDLVWDCLSGWTPPVKGLTFQTGFEPGAESFSAVTEAKQFIYELTFSITIIISDGRNYSTPYAAFDEIKLDSYLPQRKCLLTKEKRNTGLAVWRRRVDTENIEEFVVEDPRCSRAVVDNLFVTCLDDEGRASYEFEDYKGEVSTGQLQRVWKCTKSPDVDGSREYPKWFNLDINASFWRNLPSEVPNTIAEFSAQQAAKVMLSKAYFEK